MVIPPWWVVIPPDGWLYPLSWVVIPLGWVVIPPTFTLDADFHGDHESGLSQLFRVFAMFRPLHMVVRVLTAKWV